MTTKKNADQHKNCFKSFSVKKPPTTDLKKLHISSLPSSGTTEILSAVKFNECYCRALERKAMVEVENVESESSKNGYKITNTCHNDETVTKYEYPFSECGFNNDYDLVQGYDNASKFSHFHRATSSLYTNYEQWLQDIIEYRRRNWKECHANATIMHVINSRIENY